MKRDLATAYAASFARVASWAIVAGLVYRHDGEIAYAAFSYQRVAISVMMISGLGLAPALVILLPRFGSTTSSISEKRLFTVGLCIAIAAAVILTGTGFAVADRLPRSDFWLFFSGSFLAFLIATGIRLISDVIGAWLQTHEQLQTDYLLQAGGDAIWAVAVIGQYLTHPNASRGNTLVFAGIAYLIANLLLIGGRAAMMPANFKRFAFRSTGVSRVSLSAEHGRDARATKASLLLLLGTGSVLLIAQVADLLYAPANQAIIKRFLSADALATYAPLLHIDAALLLAVTGLSNLLLPKSAIAHGAGDHAGVRRYYVLGSLASFILLAGGAATVWILATPIFKTWFGTPLPATQAILPLVMIHTVIGGSAGVGRSILFGIGRIRAYTIAAILGGLANVALAILFVTQTNLGLKGIVLATIITVTIRCAIWMPWYILKTLRQPTVGHAGLKPVTAAPPPNPGRTA